MIEPTDEMLAAFADEMREPVPVRERPERIRKGLAAVLAIVEHHQVPTQDAYDAAVRALEKHRGRADLAETALAEFRDKLAALAAIEDYIGESGENAARNIRDLLAGHGADDNDPRVQARAWGLEWAATAPHQSDRCAASAGGMCVNMTDGHVRCDEGECVVPADPAGKPSSSECLCPATTGPIAYDCPAHTATGSSLSSGGADRG